MMALRLRGQWTFVGFSLLAAVDLPGGADWIMVMRVVRMLLLFIDRWRHQFSLLSLLLLVLMRILLLVLLLALGRLLLGRLMRQLLSLRCWQLMLRLLFSDLRAHLLLWL